MPTPTKGPRLGGGPAHERLILANLATSLFEHDQITTTEAKAKRLRPLAERLVTFAKRGDLHARRRVLTVVKRQGCRAPSLHRDRARHGRASRRLHPHHQDRRPQGRQRPHGRDRARPRAASPRRPPSRRPRPPPSARPSRPRPRRPRRPGQGRGDRRGRGRAETTAAVEAAPRVPVAANEDGSSPDEATPSRATPTREVPRAGRPVVRADGGRGLVRDRRRRRGGWLHQGRRLTPACRRRPLAPRGGRPWCCGPPVGSRHGQCGRGDPR